jgi:hypothetical protein
LAGETRQFSDGFSLGVSFLGFHGMYRSSGSLEGYKCTVPTNSGRWYVKRSGGKPEKTALDYGTITTAELGHVKDTPHWEPYCTPRPKRRCQPLWTATLSPAARKKHSRNTLHPNAGHAPWLCPKAAAGCSGRAKTPWTAIAMAVLSCELKSEFKSHVIGMDDKLTSTLAEIEADDFK